MKNGFQMVSAAAALCLLSSAHCQEGSFDCPDTAGKCAAARSSSQRTPTPAAQTRFNAQIPAAPSNDAKVTVDPARSTQIEGSVHPGAVKIPQTRSTPVVVPAGTFDDMVPPESGSAWRVHPVEVGYMWSLMMRAETNDGLDVHRSMWRGLRLSIHNPSRLHRASVRIECGDQSPLPSREVAVGEGSFATVQVTPDGDEDVWRGVRFEYGTPQLGAGQIAVAECAVHADRPIMVAAIVTEIIRESALHNAFQQGPSRNERGYDASQRPPIQQATLIWPAFRLTRPDPE